MSEQYALTAKSRIRERVPDRGAGTEKVQWPQVLSRKQGTASSWRLAECRCQQASGMACVNEGSHSFTCHPKKLKTHLFSCKRPWGPHL